MDFDELRELFEGGLSFEAAYADLCEDDTAYAVEAFEVWQEWQAEK